MPKNLQKAREWTAKAAAQSLPRAITLLSKIDLELAESAKTAKQ